MSEAEIVKSTLSTGYEHLTQRLGVLADMPLEGAMIAFDTNVLLDFYRRHFSTIENILHELHRIKQQLFLPAQVQKEFWSRRDEVLHLVRDTSSAKDVSEAERSVKRAIDSAARWDINTEEQAELKQLVDGTFQKIRTATAGRSATERAVKALQDPSTDAVLLNFDDIFRGRVGDPPSPERLLELAAVADGRFQRRQPPGYMDAQKINGGYGDYMLWEQLIDRATTDQRPVILVTNDQKEDWWRLFDGKTPFNARFELVQEMLDRARVSFNTLTFDQFLGRLADEPGSDIIESAVDDEWVEESATAPEEFATWTRDEFVAVLDRAEQLGHLKQKKVMLMAASQEDGVLQRSVVLDLLELPPEAKLTGFTKPIRNIQVELADEGVIRIGLPHALAAGYNGPGKAQRFAIPIEVARLNSRL